MLASCRIKVMAMLVVGVFSLLASNAVAAGKQPLDVQARRAGEDVRRAAEDAYRTYVPPTVKRNAENVVREANKATKAVGQFVKGLTGK